MNAWEKLNEIVIEESPNAYQTTARGYGGRAPGDRLLLLVGVVDAETLDRLGPGALRRVPDNGSPRSVTDIHFIEHNDQPVPLRVDYIPTNGGTLTAESYCVWPPDLADPVDESIILAVTKAIRSTV